MTSKRDRPRRKGAVSPEAWRELSRAVFAREGWRCLSCRRYVPLTAHHIIPRSVPGGPGDVAENLVSLCGGPGGCHERVQLKWRDYVPVFQGYLSMYLKGVSA